MNRSCQQFQILPRRRNLLASAATGAVGLLSQGTADQTESPGFGSAKRILLIYLQGAASQFETWDPKPEAPEAIRGKLGAIATSVPGTFICEGLPRLSQLTDRLALVRSMTHDYNNHSNLYTLSGFPAVDFSSETNPYDTRHRPFFASVIDYLADQSGSPRPQGMPRSIGLPWKFSSFSPFTKRSGPYGTFLGHGYDPVWTEFDGEATSSAPRVSFFRALKSVNIKDPFLGITPDSRLRLSKEAQLRADLSTSRLDQRRKLLQKLEVPKSSLRSSLPGRSLDRFSDMAYSLITSTQLQEALEIENEPDSVRERYGMNLFGQSALTARRLLESGCPLVSVFWDEYKVINTAWDTHFNHFSRLEQELLPGFDLGMSALLTDLEQTGLLNETLVMCLTEHGRTPKIDNFNRGGGRNHWSGVYSVMLAGAGIQGGTVVGASDERGAFVSRQPVSPEDILATMYHLHGISPDATIPNRAGQPVRLIDHGNVVQELLA